MRICVYERENVLKMCVCVILLMSTVVERKVYKVFLLLLPVVILPMNNVASIDFCLVDGVPRLYGMGVPRASC